MKKCILTIAAMLVAIIASAVVRTPNMVITPGAAVPTDGKIRLNVTCPNNNVERVDLTGTMFNPTNGGKSTIATQSQVAVNGNHVSSYDCAISYSQDVVLWFTATATFDDGTTESVQFPMTYMPTLGQNAAAKAWLPKGEGTLTESILANIPGFESYGTQTYKVEIERKANTEGLYRIKNIFANNPKMAGLTSDEDYYVYFNLPMETGRTTVERGGSTTWNDFMIPLEIPGLDGTLVLGTKHMAYQAGIISSNNLPFMSYNRETRVANYGTSLQATVVGGDTKSYTVGKMILKMPETINIIAKATDGGTVKVDTKGKVGGYLRSFITGTAGQTGAAWDLANNSDEHYAVLTATTKSGYEFMGWTDSEGNTVSTASSYTCKPTKSDELTANFSKKNFIYWNLNGQNGYSYTITANVYDYYDNKLSSGDRLYYGYSKEANCDDPNNPDGKYISISVNAGWTGVVLAKATVNGTRVPTGLLEDGYTYTIDAKYLQDNPNIELYLSQPGPAINLTWLADDEVKRAGLEEPFMIELTGEPVYDEYGNWIADNDNPVFNDYTMMYEFDFDNATRLENGMMIKEGNSVMLCIPYETMMALDEMGKWNVTYVIHDIMEQLENIESNLSYGVFYEYELCMVLSTTESGTIWDDEYGEMPAPRKGYAVFEFTNIFDDLDIVFNAFSPEFLDIKTVGEELNDDTNAPVEYYNINGVRVNLDNAASGVYIKRQGEKAEKVYIQK